MLVAFYLEPESEEVHDVITRCGRLHVTAVHVHRIHELLAPCLRAEFELHQLQVSFRYNSPHQTIEFWKQILPWVVNLIY